MKLKKQTDGEGLDFVPKRKNISQGERKLRLWAGEGLHSVQKTKVMKNQSQAYFVQEKGCLKKLNPKLSIFSSKENKKSH